MINTMDPQNTSSYDQIQRLTDLVEKSVLPANVRQNLLERIARLKLLNSSVGYIVEYENTGRYITWVINLPWEKRSNDTLDLVKAKAILDKNHFGLSQTKERILEYLASMMLNIKNNGIDFRVRAPIICLVGLAGTGKTTLAASIAESMGRSFERIPFGGLGDSRVLRGQSRAYPDAEPGAIIKKLVNAGTRNCVILLDELDRISNEVRSDVMGILVEMLDPEQNKAFTDHYIDYPFDLSEVLFVATANNTTNIATAVLDRLEVIQMPSYSDEEKIVIARSYLFPKIRCETGLKDDQMTIGEDVWAGIIRPLGFDSGIRSLERTIQGMCRKAARIIIEEKAANVAITAQNVKAFMPI